ncbi:hypothetical protein EXIGLDRAFT_775246, partial [Exidia glandulosa HHB12029]
FKSILRKLHASPADFSPDDVRLAIEHIIASPPAATPAQIGAFLSALQLTGVERLPSTLAAASDALLQRAIIRHIEGDDAGTRADIIDTGGDGHNVFNVSTTAAIVEAGIGLRVIKHGHGHSDLSPTASSASVALPASLISPPTSISPTLAPNARTSSAGRSTSRSGVAQGPFLIDELTTSTTCTRSYSSSTPSSTPTTIKVAHVIRRHRVNRDGTQTALPRQVARLDISVWSRYGAFGAAPSGDRTHLQRAERVLDAYWLKMFELELGSRTAELASRRTRSLDFDLKHQLPALLCPSAARTLNLSGIRVRVAMFASSRLHAALSSTLPRPKQPCTSIPPIHASHLYQSFRDVHALSWTSPRSRGVSAFRACQVVHVPSTSLRHQQHVEHVLSAFKITYRNFGRGPACPRRDRDLALADQPILSSAMTVSTSRVWRRKTYPVAFLTTTSSSLSCLERLRAPDAFPHLEHADFCTSRPPAYDVSNTSSASQQRPRLCDSTVGTIRFIFAAIYGSRLARSDAPSSFLSHYLKFRLASGAATSSRCVFAFRASRVAHMPSTCVRRQQHDIRAPLAFIRGHHKFGRDLRRPRQDRAFVLASDPVFIPNTESITALMDSTSRD